MPKTKVTVTPSWCDCPHEEGNNVCLQVELPGVKKEDVTLSVREDAFSLKAERDDVEYTGSWAFCCLVEEDKVQAKFDNGLLTVQAPLKKGPPFKKVSIE